MSLALALLVFAPAAGAVVPDLLGTTPEGGKTGNGAGQMRFPWGVVAEPDPPGHIYVVDPKNSRIDEFTAWGEFVKAFGWKVDAGAPEERLQSCTTASTCEAGTEGPGAGQFSNPEGVALDPAGDLYVVESGNHRVQKFDPAGHFLFMFGGSVNKTAVEEGRVAEEDVCPAAGHPIDVCQAGVAGSGPGQFGAGEARYVNNLTIDPSTGAIFIGEGNTERVQVFKPDGAYKEEIKLPAEKKVRSLIFDGKENRLIAAFFGEEGGIVRTLKPSGPTAEFLPLTYTAESRVKALALDSQGNLYTAVLAGPGSEPERVLEFNAEGECLDCGSGGEAGAPGFDRPTDGSALWAIASGAACGPEDVYVAHFGGSSSYLNIFGPAPNPGLCPQPVVPPEITDQFAASVGTESARLGARINPRFWPDTAYYVEYGTTPCSQGGCSAQPAPPGQQLTSQVVKAPIEGSIPLSGLTPDTTYHYRFVAQSGGGGPVRGLGGEVGDDGLEGTFHTFPLPAPPNANCENQQFRTATPSVALPDCRAYEQISPAEKGGADIIAFPSLQGRALARLDQATPGGDALTYTAYRAFADPASSFYSNQYLARRDPNQGWQDTNISPPGSAVSFYETTTLLNSLYQAFSEDLCSSFYLQGADVALAPGDQPGFPDLYHERNCDPSGYDLLTTAAPANPVPPPPNTYSPRVQGFSADGSRAVFRANAKLATSGTAASDATHSEDGTPVNQLYLNTGAGPLRLVSVLPGGSAAGLDSSVGTFGNNSFDYRADTLAHAVSPDATRVFWTTPVGASQSPKLYLRLNADHAQSAFAHGSATGTGSLTEGSKAVTSLVAAAGKAAFTLGSPTVTLLETTTGRFVAGQPVTSSKVPSGTTILSVSPDGATLTLSANANATSASSPISSAGPAPFAVAQTIAGAGIPPGTTIAAVAPGSLTLSANATEKQTKTALTATSACTEPEAACTLAVSESVGPGPATFWAATPQGTKALFSFASDPHGGELYTYDVATRTPTLIAPGVAPVFGASDDLTRVYFVSSKDLGAGPNPEGDLAVAGQNNLYLYRQGQGPAFIGTLANRGAGSDDNATEETSSKGNTFRVSPDGEHAAFMSIMPLTGYDNTDLASGKADAEVYRYDATANGAAGGLTCVSCNPSGARPQGREVEDLGGKLGPWHAAQIPFREYSLHAARALSDDGNRLFFESFDALLPTDVNGKEDVYEWEAAGSGDCTAQSADYFARNGGCLSLISTGQDPRDSSLVDASADGSDVFLSTAQQLYAGDVDSLIDLYDARVGGGFPPPPPVPPPCDLNAGACEGQGTTAPSAPGAGTAVFQGPGNEPKATPQPCRRGLVKRHGKCVKKHTRRHRHHRAANRNRRAGK